jgi:5-methylcytosine-specific restriction endonuclease McrA
MFRTISDKKKWHSPYLQSLSGNEYWEEVKRRVRMRDNYTCQKCRVVGRHEVHHLIYKVNGQSIVGKELFHLDCLILLCGKCHQSEHKKKK